MIREQFWRGNASLTLIVAGHYDHGALGLPPSPALSPEIEHIVEVDVASSGENTDCPATIKVAWPLTPQVRWLS